MVAVGPANGANDFGLVRYNSDGSLDTNFGTGGKVATDIDNGSTDLINDVAIDSNGRIVVVGTTVSAGNFSFAVLRYNSDGSLDTTFDSDGKALTDVPDYVGENAYAVKIDANGKIVVVGDGVSQVTAKSDFVLARYNTDGSLDTSFGTNGIQTADFGNAQDHAKDLAFDGSGRIVVAGKTAAAGVQQFAVARFNADGSLDTSFSGDGKQTTDFSSTDSVGESIALDGNGKIVVAGATLQSGEYEFALARYNTDGSPDTSFGSSGIVTTDFGSVQDTASGVAIDSSGRILAGGSSQTQFGAFAVARYLANGSLDTTFGVGGKVTTSFAPDSLYLQGNDLALDSNGNIVIAGTNYYGSFDVAVARYQTGTSPNPKLSISDASVAEGNSSTTTLSFTVTLSEAASSGFTVAYSTQNGTATTANNDYVAISNGSLSFAGTAGETKTITVTVNGDTNIELNETLSVILGTITGNSQVTILDGTGQGTILNDDAGVGGNLDPTFDLDGFLTKAIGTGNDSANDVAFQTDGKIVVVGTTVQIGGSEFTVLRYNEDGTLDTSFGTGGIVKSNFGGGAGGNAVAIDSSGRIVAAGVFGANLTLLRYNPNGSLDTTFGSGGIQSTLVGSSANAYGMTIAADGKIVVAGYTNTPVNNFDFLVARYNTDGSLDSTFDGDGFQITDFGGTFDSVFGDPAIDSSGRIVVAGVSNAGGIQHFAVARYTATGALDTTFDGDGKVIPTFSGSQDFATSVAIDGNGKILVAGKVTADFAIARYNTNGSLDSSFGTGGLVTTDFGGSDQIEGLKLRNNGQIVVAGYTDASGNNDFALARYNANGTLDTSFSGDGQVTTDIGGVDNRAVELAIQSDGKIVVVGNVNNGGNFDIAIARYLVGPPSLSISDASVTEGNNGTATLSFTVTLSEATLSGFTVAYSTQNGTATTANNDYVAISSGSLSFAGTAGETQTISVTVNGDTAFEPDETLSVLLGTITGNSLVATLDGTGQGTILNDDAAPLPAGSLDPTFDFDGLAKTDLGGINNYARDMVIQPDGKIVVIGQADSGELVQNFQVARYNPDGSLDTSFGAGGKVSTDLSGGSSDFAYGVALDSQGRIVVVGRITTGGVTQFAVVRYNSNGSLDTSFGGGDGIVAVDILGTNETATDVAIDANGKIVVVGSVNSPGSGGSNFAIARLNTDGSPDTTFNVGSGQTQADFMGGNDSAQGVAIDGNGKIVVVGYAFVSGTSTSYFALARFNSDGTVDNSFGVSGQQLTSFGNTQSVATDVAIDGNGKIVVAGSTNDPVTGSDFAVARYNNNGLLDTSFGVGGLQHTDFNTSGDNANAVAIDRAGRIVLGGSSALDFAVVRYLSNGTLDTSFSGDGKVTTAVSAGNDNIEAIAIDGNSNIVAAGFDNGVDFVVARYLAGPTLSIGDASITEGNGFTRTLLSEDFNTDNEGYASNNLTDLATWKVTGGGISIYGSGPQNTYNNFYPTNGFFVNLGGNSGGRLETKDTFTLLPGQYLLTFDLGNNPLGGGSTNTMTVSLGNVFSKSYSRTGSTPLGTITELITVTTPTTAKLAFDESADPDGNGLIIDNVSLVAMQSASVMTFTVTLSASTSTPFTVPYFTQDGTATFINNDYSPINNVPLRIGSFDSSRGGYFSLVNGSGAATMKSLIQTNFPTATFSSSSTLTDAFLSSIDVLWLNSIGDDNTPVTPLSGLEQANLLNFVNKGKSVLLFGDQDGFNDDSFFGPFGAETTGVNNSTVTITNHTDPITNGPFGAVNSISGYYGGKLTTLGSAVPLATYSTGGQTAVAVDQPGALSPTSGRVILFGDTDFYTGNVGFADNTKLLLNALAATKPVNSLTFAGTAGETHTISVIVNGDINFEPDQTLSVVLGTPTGNTQVGIADGTGQGTIQNDDVYSAGDLDPTFNGTGTAAYSFGASTEAYGTAVQSDGKVVVTGYGNVAFLERYNVDGTLDSSFGTGGIVTFTNPYLARAVAIQSDGKIVVAGRAVFNGQYHFAATRYNSDGTLDTNFGVNGVAYAVVGGIGSYAYDLLIQPDGKIVLGGSATYYNGITTRDGIGLARFNANGTLDSTFNGGTQFFTYGSLDNGFGGMALDANGRLMVVGSYNSFIGFNGATYLGSNFLMIRFGTNGAVDSYFSTGLSNWSEYASDVVIQPDGKIVILGGFVIGGPTGRYEYGLLRLTAGGAIDTSFGDGDGFALHNSRAPSYLALQANGQIVTVGRGYDDHAYATDFGVTRYNPDGSLDTNFKVAGTADVLVGTYYSTPSAVAIAPDGSIVVAGSTYTLASGRYDVAVARLNGGPSIAGLQPTTFPGGGTVTATGPHTLTTGTGDGSVTLGVDGYGAFGSQNGPNGTDATYDPIGATGASGTTWGSALAIRVGNSGPREFLTSGTFGGFATALSRPAITGTTTDASSSFSHDGLDFSLAQSVDPLYDNDGVQTGSLLTQTYTITNPTASQIDFELLRYLEGDLRFANGYVDGGGRFVTAAGDELIYETDIGGTSSTSTTFVGISGKGGTAPTTNRYELGVYPAFGSGIQSGNALGNVIAGDGNGDGFVDAANTADVGVALRNTFSLLAGATTTYTTHTLFGNGVPSNIGTNPNQPAPAPATSVSVAIGATTSVAENSAQQLIYTLTRSGDTTGALTVNVTFGGAASLGSDYSQSGATIVSGNNATVTFAAGSATAVVTVTPLDDLSVESAEDVKLTVASGAGYTVGTPSTDTGNITDNDTANSASFTIPSDGSVRVVRNGNNVEIRSVPGDVLLTSRDVTTLGGGLTIVGGSGPDDTLIVDESNGSPIPAGGLNFDAGTGNDRLVVIGDGTQNPNYSPDGTTNGTGDVTQATGTIHFTGVENSDFDNVGTFTLVTPNANDVVNLANGMLGSGQDATSISGTSGGVGFTQANVRNSGIAIDTTSVAGTDTVTVTSASNNHGNTSLNVIAGAEAGDIININGTTTFSGTTTLDAKTINLNANVTNAVTGSTATLVNVTAPGQIQDGIDAVAGGGTVHIAAGSYSGNVDTSAKSVSLDPAGAVSSTGNWTLDNNDTLNVAINGTTAGTQYDQINVTGNLALGGAILNVTGSYTPLKTDTFDIVKATGTVTGSLDASTYFLNNKPLTPTYTATAPGKVVLGFDSTPDLAGTGGDDNFVVSRDNNGNVVVTRNGVPVLTVPEGDLTNLTIAPGGGDDTLVIDASNGDPIPSGGLTFDAGLGNDRLVIIGDGTQNPNDSPDGTTNGKGSVGMTIGTINFLGLEQTDFDNVGTFTLTTPNGDDTVNLANGSLGSGQDATSISGNSGGVGFPTANVRNSGIVIDTTSVGGTDNVTVNSANNNHGNTSLNVKGGTEAGDVININGTTTFSGTTTLDAKTINLTANVTNGVSGSTATKVNVSGAGQIQDGIDAVANGGTVNIASGTYSGDVNTSSKSVTLDLEPSVADVHSTGNWTLDSNDALNFVINGTTPVTQYEQLNITGDIALGGAQLNLFGTHVPAPADTFEIIKATGTVSGSLNSTSFLNGKPLTGTYTAGPPGNVTLGFDATPSIEGGAGADDFEVSLDNSGNIIVKRNGVEVLNTPLAGLTELTIDASGNNDKLFLDLRNGNPIPLGGLTYNGGDGDDEAYIRGTNGEVVKYTPDAQSNGSGKIDIDGKLVFFTGLEPVDFDSLLSFTLDLPNGDDLVSITNGFNSALTALAEPAGTVPAMVFSGTSGGIGFESAHVFRTTNVTVDTTINTDGDDTITVVSADNAHGNTNLSIITGSGSDAVNFVGAINVSGTVTISTVGPVTDNVSDSVTDITAATLSITAGSIGASGNDLDTSVGSLTTDTSAANGDQFLNEASGLTDVNLNAGSGDITLIAGAITDSDAATDFAADALTVTATSFGASGNNIDTSVNSLSVDTSASSGDQYIHESTGLTDLNLNAGGGDITLVDEGQISDTSNDGTDITADSFSFTISTSGEFGTGGNFIDTNINSWTSSTSNQDRNIYVNELNSLVIESINAGQTVFPDNHLNVGGNATSGAGRILGNALNLTAGGFIDIKTTVSQLNLTTTANGNITVDETNNLGQLNIDAGAGDVSITAGGAITDGDGAQDIAADDVSLTATSLGASGFPLQLNANTLTTDTDDVTDGDQYLSEANSLTVGAADLNAGTATLYLVGGAFLTASGGDILNNVVVQSGATLGGSGTVTGTVQVNSSGTVAPGASTGILSTGDVTFASGSNFNVEVNGNVAGTSYDQLNVTGTVDLGGATLVTSGLVNSTPGQQIVLINNDGTDSIVGTFNGLAEGATVIIHGVTFYLSYVGGSNANDVTLTEAGPATYTSDGVGAGALELRLNANSVQFVDDGVVVDSRPLAAVQNQLITINGSDPASETLKVNYAFGGFFDVDVAFNGGTGPGGNDKLIVDGGTFTNVTHTFTTVLPAENSGNIVYDTATTTTTISYTGLEPVDMTGSTITDLVFNLPVGAANDFRLEDDGNLANGLTRIISNGGTFETTVFVNPTGSLKINAGGVGDYFNLYQLDNGFTAPITFNGGAGADRMYVHTTASTTTIPTGGVSFVGSGNNDGFAILPGYVATTIAHSFTNSNDGSVNIDGRTINYDDMSVTVGIYDQLTATNRTFQFAAGNDTIAFGDDPAANDNFSRISSSGSVTTDFKNPSATFSLKSGDGNDAITIGSFAGLDAQFVAAVTIDGEGNTDSITQNAAMTLGSGTSTGNLSLTAETIDLNAPITTTAGTVGTVTLSGTDISINAAINAGGNVSATATNNIDLTSGSITTSGSVTASAGDALTTDASGTDITAASASLSSGAGGIGSSTNPIRLSVDTLVTNSNGLSDGDQFLFEADSLNIGAADLDAGSATITLAGGTFFTAAGQDILSNTVVRSGTTLAGTGSVTGSVNVQSGGTVSPATAATTGVINTGSATFTSGSSFNVQVNGNVVGTGYDQLNVTGGVNLGGATLNASGTIPSLTGQTIVLINNDSNDPVVGTFAGLAEGDTVYINGIGFKLSYVGGTGNDVTLKELIQVTVTVSPASVAEDSNQKMYYTFHRNGVDDVMTVNFGISGTAVVIDDFDNPSGHIRPGSSTGTFTFGYGQSDYVIIVVPNADTIVEGNETLTLTLLPGPTYVPGLPNFATATIVEDDSVQQVSVAVSPSSVTEDGSGNLIYTFTRTGGSALQQAAPLTVKFGVSGAATFGTDYTQFGATTFGSTGTVTFGHGISTATVTVDPTPDSDFEPAEDVVLTLAADPAYGIGAPSSATGTITNDDLAPPEVSVTVSPNVLEDGTTNLIYTFTRTGNLNLPLTANFTATGTASFITDYALSGAATFSGGAGTVSFGYGQATKTIVVNPQADTTVELDESVILTVTGGTGYAVGASNQATGQILNDDFLPTVQIAVSPSSVAEDGSTNIQYTFTRTGNLNLPLAVNFSVGGGATFITDYAASGAKKFTATSGVVKFGYGVSTAVVTINPTPDTLVETNEDVVLTIDPSANYSITGSGTATGTITEDDATQTVGVSVSPNGVQEDGSPNLIYTFTRTGGSALQLSRPLVVNFNVGGGVNEATFVTDYTQSGAKTFSATAGKVSFGHGVSTAKVIINPKSDLIVENDEVVTMQIVPDSNYLIGTGLASGTILNDDFVPTVQVTVSPLSVSENSSQGLVYTFTRSNTKFDPLTVNFSVGGGINEATFGTDYTQSGAQMFSASSGKVTFGHGQSTVVVIIRGVADLIAEPTEDVTIKVLAGTGYDVGAIDTAIGTLLDALP